MNEKLIFTPGTIAELIEALNAAEGRTVMLAGCTDLLAGSKRELSECWSLVDLSGIRELSFIELQKDTLVIGACATFTEISESDTIKKHANCLVQAAGLVGSPQIRNRATIGGNVANCSPAADSIPALLVLGASVRLIDRTGKARTVLLEEFLKTDVQSFKSEKCLIESFRIPLTKDGQRSAFARIGARSTVTISKLSLAISFEKDAEHRIRNPKLALGSVGRTAFRSSAAERLLEGKTLGNDDSSLLAEELGGILSAELEIKLAGRASMPYKKIAVTGLVYDLFDRIGY